VNCPPALSPKAEAEEHNLDSMCESTHLSLWLSHAQRFLTCTFCTTLRPLPMGGACVNTTTCLSLFAASTPSNQAICSSSMYTSCTLWLQESGERVNMRGADRRHT
jgi:hypothetical protein